MAPKRRRQTENPPDVENSRDQAIICSLEAMTEMFRSIVSNQNKNQKIQQEQNLKQNQERPVDTGSARAREQNKKQNQDRP